MPRPLHKLSDRAVSAAKRPGRHSDGGGLYLNVSSSGSKSWVFMWTHAGKRREMGLGAYPAVSLAKARAMAVAHRVAVEEGRDPIAERAKRPEPTFGQCADEYVQTIQSQWRNAKHREQWVHAVKVRCASIRDKRVSEITTDDVLVVLRQQVAKKYRGQTTTGEFWRVMPETAGRVRSRIERVLNYAKTQGWRSGENPAAWVNHLENVLPRRPRLMHGHQVALHYDAIPDLMQKVQKRSGLSARALELTILTAVRTAETIGMCWSEIDFDARLWTVPSERTKPGEENEVPLSDRAVEILRELWEHRTSERFVFPGQPNRRSKSKDIHLSNMAMLNLVKSLAPVTVHGFRSTFRDWCGDKTNFPRELAEAALSHKVGNSVEQAYRRSSALAKRRRLMQAWQDYCYQTKKSNVVALARRGPAVA